MFGFVHSFLVKLQSEHNRSFNQKKFLLIMIGLIVTSIIDISIVKINDLIDKNFIPLQGKLILFTVNSFLCLLLQFFLVRYIHVSFQRDRLNRTLKVKTIYIISFTFTICVSALIGFFMFQQFHNNYYGTSISIAIVAIKLWNSIWFYDMVVFIIFFMV